MAWTTSDLTLIETAIRTAMTDGIASVSISGQAVQTYTLKQLMDMRAQIKAELASANVNNFGGMRVRKTIPPSCG